MLNLFIERGLGFRDRAPEPNKISLSELTAKVHLSLLRSRNWLSVRFIMALVKCHVKTLK